MTHLQADLGSAEQIARLAWHGLSVGASGDGRCIGVGASRPVARLASALATENRPRVIAPWDVAQILNRLPVGEFTALAPRSRAILQGLGLRTCGQLAAQPRDVLVRHLGDVGRTLWLTCRGLETPETAELAPDVRVVKVLPPRTTNPRVIGQYLKDASVMMGRILRRAGQRMSNLQVTLTLAPPGDRLVAAFPVEQWPRPGTALFETVRPAIGRLAPGQSVLRIELIAVDPVETSGQLGFPASGW